jgi:hypothetical protein
MQLNNAAYIEQQDDGTYKIKAGFKLGLDDERIEVEGETLQEAQDKFVEKVQKYGMEQEGFHFVQNIDL